MTNIKRIHKYLTNIIRCAIIALSVTFTASLEAKGYDSTQINCLAKNAYMEARGQGEEGMLAVIFTTLNRVKSGKFPDSICGVVYQSRQFSWTSNRPPIKEPEVYAKAKELAQEAVRGKHKDNTFGATYFHSTGIKPYWTKDMKCTTKIGGHKFYKPK